MYMKEMIPKDDYGIFVDSKDTARVDSMFVVPILPIKERTSGQSSKKSAKSKTVKLIFLNLRSGTMQERFWEIISQSHGGYLTLNTGEFPREENASTLSQILMAQVRKNII